MSTTHYYEYLLILGTVNRTLESPLYGNFTFPVRGNNSAPTIHGVYQFPDSRENPSSVCNFSGFFLSPVHTAIRAPAKPLYGDFYI